MHEIKRKKMTVCRKTVSSPLYEYHFIDKNPKYTHKKTSLENQYESVFIEPLFDSVILYFSHLSGGKEVTGREKGCWLIPQLPTPIDPLVIPRPNRDPVRGDWGSQAGTKGLENSGPLAAGLD